MMCQQKKFLNSFTLSSFSPNYSTEKWGKKKMKHPKSQFPPLNSTFPAFHSTNGCLIFMLIHYANRMLQMGNPIKSCPFRSRYIFPPNDQLCTNSKLETFITWAFKGIFPWNFLMALFLAILLMYFLCIFP